ncbi:MAG: hypothetical protein EOO28_01260 [Comamonadaceae bacterium]|nr:MAG: hypothetical protein EOO28_01260 [Comamonadaceae bacterium]
MNPLNPYGDIDLTSYLQTEGRRRAAELARQQSAMFPATLAPPVPEKTRAAGQQVVQQDSTSNQTPAQEQQSRAPRQAGSLTEVLQQMGVTSGGRRSGR